MIRLLKVSKCKLEKFDSDIEIEKDYIGHLY